MPSTSRGILSPLPGQQHSCAHLKHTQVVYVAASYSDDTSLTNASSPVVEMAASIVAVSWDEIYRDDALVGFKPRRQIWKLPSSLSGFVNPVAHDRQHSTVRFAISIISFFSLKESKS
jgi:hypothetical protein